ncbi:hypothetical protein IG604_19625, partial [Vibrio cholerae]|nr:hypothetical protein [Vibrio cholerae]
CCIRRNTGAINPTADYHQIVDFHCTHTTASNVRYHAKMSVCENIARSNKITKTKQPYKDKGFSLTALNRNYAAILCYAVTSGGARFSSAVPSYDA